MTPEQAQEIVDEMGSQFPAHKAEVYENYSGRGMYGKKCTGIVTDNPLAVLFCAGYVAASRQETEYDEELESWQNFEPPLNQDSMGLDTIVY